MASGFDTPLMNSPRTPTVARCRRLGPGRIELRRGDQVWRFAIDRPSRVTIRRMLCELTRLAESPDHPLDWFDAALVSDALSREPAHGTPSGPQPNTCSGAGPERED